MSQLSTNRHIRWSLLGLPVAGVLVLAGCSGPADNGGSSSTEDPAATGFSIMVAEANDADDYYAQLAAEYADEAGIEIEVIPYPSDAYNTQVTTQFQAGNAADVAILSPGTGQPISVITLAEAGFLEPLDDTSASILPVGSESQFQIDGETYAQPTSLTPVGMIFNVTAGDEAGIEYPETYEDLLEACSAARDAGKTFTVLAGGIPFNTGLFTQLISATRVYAETPDWNEQRAAGDVTFADSGWRDVLDDVVEMNDSGCFQDGAAGGTFDNITAGLGGGTSLTAAVPGSAAASISSATGSDLNVQAFPPDDGQDAFTLTGANYAWAINASSDDAVKQSAQAFLDWAAEPENAQHFAEISGAVPITGIDPETLLPSYEPIGELLASGSYTSIPNSSWPNPAVYDALGAGVQGLLTGQSTVDQILEEMDAAWDQ
ncbi:ABC transporter substrate-binding protein [Microbacterium sp. zg.B48]|uniref:ABC transporter substrate-binding protein n=1 Tax=unclassified Microbacterium TaxID=2609290 RepID=UPI00214B7B52|nr:MULTISPECIES: ABC transporter substrate-binding protein [unclassified Microbacterium]MCR2762947.1 ABC transporter substrate-binding protein [Microbacterium sp. zg.B48]MCR2808534.1 ABC transporter substrate-binding protein [Microbacterium sp. zg.B185]WIM19026.1 ABC transporter substrate-binding protein [Microbacterium sp. zg-B185]